jgi:hypothetical protein
MFVLLGLLSLRNCMPVDPSLCSGADTSPRMVQQHAHLKSTEGDPGKATLCPRSRRGWLGTEELGNLSHYAHCGHPVLPRRLSRCAHTIT